MSGGPNTFGPSSRVGAGGGGNPGIGSIVRINGADVQGDGTTGGLVGVISPPFGNPVGYGGQNNEFFLPTVSAPIGVDPLNPSSAYNPIYSMPMSTDALAAVVGGYYGLLVASRGQLLNPAGTFDQQRGGADNADDVAAVALGALLALSRNTAFDGTTWDRVRAASAAVLAGFTSQGAMLVNKPGNWSINHTPAAATQATITRAAGGAGVRHVCTSIGGTLIIPPTVNQPIIQLNLRDGATGAGTILWSQPFGIGAALAAGGQQQVNFSGLEIVGSANTAMTLEFSAAGAATTVQGVALTGHDAS